MVAQISGLISPFRIYQWIAGLILKIVSSFTSYFIGYENYILNGIYTVLAAAGGVAVYSGYGGALASGAVGSAVGTSLFGFALGASAIGAGVAALVGLVGAFWTDDTTTWAGKILDFSKPTVANDSTIMGSFITVITTVFSGIKTLLEKRTPKWITSNIGEASAQIETLIKPLTDKIGLSGVSFTGITGTISEYITRTFNYLKSDALSMPAKIAIILTIGQLYSFATRNLDDEKMINNNFLYQMFNIITLSGKIKVDDFNKSPNDAILSYIKDEMWNNGSLGILSYMYSMPYNTLIMGETKNKNTYSLTLFNKKMQGNVSPYSLVNLNVPISSFIYAFNEVKATADKDLAKELNEYYENKDVFMEKRKQKLQKNKNT
jgi:hypothetical protein